MIKEKIIRKAEIELDKAKNKKRGVLVSFKDNLVCWCFISPISGKKICNFWKTESYEKKKEKWVCKGL